MKTMVIVALSVGMLALLAGCGGQHDPEPGHEHHMAAPVGHEGHGHAEGAELEPQATCPIMGGAVNRELYVDHDGKRIYVCCQACLAAVSANPGAALEKLAELGEYAADVPDDDG